MWTWATINSAFGKIVKGVIATPFFSQREERGRRKVLGMTRRELREQVFKMLFRAEFHNTEDMMEQIEAGAGEQETWSEKDAGYISEKCKGILNHIAEIDEAVNAVSEGWKTSRMGKVDLTLIRLAVYEMKFEVEIPTKVAINEAVELAKQYGTDDSPSFVNGVLAKLA